MQFKNLDELMLHIKNISEPRTLAVAAAHDDHCLDAVIMARDEGVICPLLIGDSEKIKRILEKMGTSVPNEQIVHESNVDRAAEMAVAFVRTGEADFLMKGMLNTANMLKPIINKETGLINKECTGVINHLNICEIPGYHKVLASSDAAYIVNPTLEQKKAILLNSVRALKQMGFHDPNIGILAAVENVNPKMIETLDAAELVRMNRSGEIPHCVVEGPMSFDIAFNKESARIKGYEGKLSGELDMILWPNVVCGNLTMKALATFLPLRSISYAVGAKVPIVITSRGASVKNKYECIVAAASAIHTQ